MLTMDAPKEGSVITADASEPRKSMLKSRMSFDGDEMIGVLEICPLASTAKA